MKITNYLVLFFTCLVGVNNLVFCVGNFSNNSVLAAKALPVALSQKPATNKSLLAPAFSKQKINQKNVFKNSKLGSAYNLNKTLKNCFFATCGIAFSAAVIYFAFFYYKKAKANRMLLNAIKPAEVVEALKAGADIEKAGDKINLVDENGNTPLHQACFNKQEDVALKLIDKGVNINATNKKNETPLHWATVKGLNKVFLKLIDMKANVNIPANTGTESPYFIGNTTVFQLLCHNGLTDIVSKLIITGVADLNFVNPDGSTALYLACRGNSPEIVKLLLEHGANIDEKSLTFVRNNPEILQLLNLAKNFENNPDKPEFIKEKLDNASQKEESNILVKRSFNQLIDELDDKFPKKENDPSTEKEEFEKIVSESVFCKICNVNKEKIDKTFIKDFILKFEKQDKQKNKQAIAKAIETVFKDCLPS